MFRTTTDTHHLGFCHQEKLSQDVSAESLVGVDHVGDRVSHRADWFHVLKNGSLDAAEEFGFKFHGHISGPDLVDLHVDLEEVEAEEDGSTEHIDHGSVLVGRGTAGPLTPLPGVSDHSVQPVLVVSGGGQVGANQE